MVQRDISFKVLHTMRRIIIYKYYSERFNIRIIRKSIWLGVCVYVLYVDTT